MATLVADSLRGYPKGASVAQNIYDSAEFFAGYSRLSRSVLGLDGAPEWPAIQAMLPDLSGKRVVDLGCGFGWFVRWARTQGAAHILGLDLSENMLERARADTHRGFGDDPAVQFQQADLDDLALPADAFDLAYSSLAFHYVKDFNRLVRTAYDALAPNGWLVFTIEHPIYMASTRPGWILRPDGLRTWPVDSYAVEGPRTTNWLAQGVVKHHRTLATTLTTLIDAGFALRRIEEWSPTADQVAQRPTLSDEMDRPLMVLVAAQKS